MHNEQRGPEIGESEQETPSETLSVKMTLLGLVQVGQNNKLRDDARKGHAGRAHVDEHTMKNRTSDICCYKSGE